MHAARLPAAALAAALLMVACGSDDDGQEALSLPAQDSVGGGADGGTSSGSDAAGNADAGTTDTAGQDAAAGDGGSSAGQDAGAVDAGPPNDPPTFATPGALSLDQGASTTLDLNPLIADKEDADADLVVHWSADHVALQDPGTHVLYVVAPTVWSGTEKIELTVMDKGGKTATATLTVTVAEVTVEQPKPRDDCGKVTFKYPAGKGQHEVLLSGTFNGWASTPDKADKLTDPGGTGVWSVDKKLEAGVYQYKFKVDGKWHADPNNANKTPDGFGGHNSVIEVGPCKP